MQNTSAQVGILTNGIRYEFYRDPNDVNVKQFTPQYTLDITEASPVDIEVLCAFCRYGFDIGSAIGSIEGAYYRDRIVERLRSACRNADESFTAWMMGEIGGGTGGLVNQQRFAQLIREALRDFTVAKRETVARSMEIGLSEGVGEEGPQKAAFQSAPHLNVDSGWTTLDDLVAGKRGEHPRVIRFPCGEEWGIKDWKDILIKIATYLEQKGHLTADRLPISEKPNSTRLIINHEPVQMNGTPFRSSKRKISEGIFLNASGGIQRAIECSRRMVAHCEQETSEFWLKTD